MDKLEMLKAMNKKYREVVSVYSLIGKAAAILGVKGNGVGASIKQMNLFFDCSSLCPSKSEDSYPGIGLPTNINEAILFMKKHSYKTG